MSKKTNKKQAVLDYIKENPNAKNSEVAKACGVHPTYASLIKRNGGVKKPKPAAKFEFKQDDFALAMRQINALKAENSELKDALIRMDGVIKYLELKIKDGTSV